MAVAGPRVHPELVVAASGLDPVAVDEAVAGLVANGLVVADENGLGFRHALAQEAVAADLGPGERAATHRRVAELLSVRHELACSSAPGSAAAERAHHWEAAGAPTRALDEAMRPLPRPTLGWHRPRRWPTSSGCCACVIGCPIPPRSSARIVPPDGARR